ncbi:unnamed protein product [Lymnaea stagnalis]|uniref:RING-type domain-containing protein n=1 Tax=Lymnaea stagnalis TaxID=6523 RepID=A0AAV2IBB1_LYMST
MASALVENGLEMDFLENSLAINNQHSTFGYSRPTAVKNGARAKIKLPLRSSHTSLSSALIENIHAPGNEDALIKIMAELPLTATREIYAKYMSAISSVSQFESLPLNFVIFCANDMETNGEIIKCEPLLSKCENLRQCLPLKFIDRLKEKLNDLSLQDREALTTSGLSPGGHNFRNISAVVASTNEIGSYIRSDFEFLSNDAVDGLSSSTERSNVLRENSTSPRSIEASLGSYNFANALAYGPEMLEENENRRTDSQTETLFGQKHTLVGESNNIESRERKANSSIMEALLAVTNENKLLEDCKLCVKCRDKPRGITFLPCGHFTMCRECAGPTYICSTCNKSVLATVDTFLS